MSESTALEMRVALTVSVADFEKFVSLYSDGLNLPVGEQWESPAGRGIILKIENATLELLDESMAVMHKQNIPGLAFGIQQGNSVLHQGYYGYANLEHQVSVNENTIFEIASVTKLMTTQAVLRLVQDGKCQLDDMLANYVQALPDTWKTITIRHCLAHQSGITDYTSIPRYLELQRKQKTPHEVLDLVRDLPLKFAPGTRYAYDNTGFYLLGMLIEAVSQKSYPVYLNEQIFAPLGMNHTQAYDYETVIMNRAQGYIYRDGAFHNKDFYDTSNTFSAGILISTVHDLLTWSESVFDDRILNADYRRLWWMPHPSQAGNERDNHFILGLGWFRVDDQGMQFWGHNGGILGFASAFFYLPARDITAVMLCNAGNIPNPHHIALNWIKELALVQTE